MTNDSNMPAEQGRHDNDVHCKHENKYSIGEGYQLQADGSYLLIKSWECRTCDKGWMAAVPGSRIWKDEKL